MSSQKSQFLKSKIVEEITGLSRTSLWRQVRAGTFPQKTKIGPNGWRWHIEDIEAWIERCRDLSKIDAEIDGSRKAIK